MNISVPFLKEPVGSGDLVKKAASALGIQQKSGCGCAKRQAAMNQALTFGPKPALHAPAVIVPRSAHYRPSVWTGKVPPEPAEGWMLIEECAGAALFASGGSWIVWTTKGGQYRSSHSFSNELRARGEFGARCPSFSRP